LKQVQTEQAYFLIFLTICCQLGALAIENESVGAVPALYNIHLVEGRSNSSAFEPVVTTSPGGISNYRNLESEAENTKLTQKDLHVVATSTSASQLC
jgi:hypothetical protein